jgi:UDP-glucuronate 4-epimerase
MPFASAYFQLEQGHGLLYSARQNSFFYLVPAKKRQVKILVTGAAGFIGFHMSKALVAEGHEVYGFDNLNAYYDVRLKYARLQQLGIGMDNLIQGKAMQGIKGFTFYYLDLIDSANLLALFAEVRPDVVIHLAAQAGVRHSIYHPQSYMDSNIQGFFTILEACRRYPVKHLVYASSSSVYGDNKEIPFKESDRTNKPVSLYGATKKAGEILAHSYVALYKIPSTGLRFFTVYGPWGRPDMAYFKFADQIMHGEAIDVYNQGNMERDFTYVDDIINGINALIHHPPGETDGELHRIVNIGRSSPVNLLTFIKLLEKYLGKEAEKNFLPIQPGDVPSTWADTTELKKITGYSPSTDLEEGIRKFVDWYKSYQRIT